MNIQQPRPDDLVYLTGLDGQEVVARKVYPADPLRTRSMWEPANVRETWARARAEMEGAF